MAYSREEIEILDKLAKKMGAKQASMFMSVLGKELQFVNAIKSTIGQEIYKDCVACAEANMEKIIEDAFESEKDELKTKAELRAYIKIMARWTERIDNYYKRQEKFKSIAGGK